MFNWLKRYNERGLRGSKEIRKGRRKKGNLKWNKAMFEERLDKYLKV